jgi:hypothetical protein
LRRAAPQNSPVDAIIVVGSAFIAFYRTAGPVPMAKWADD